MKKYLSIFLALTLALTMLAGCASNMDDLLAEMGDAVRGQGVRHH